MIEEKVLGFENSITSYVYLEFANDNKHYYRQSRCFYKMTIEIIEMGVDPERYDPDLYSGQRVKECIFRDVLQQWYENRQEKNFGEMHSMLSKTELEPLFTYALSRINWDEIAISLIRDIEEP